METRTTQRLDEAIASGDVGLAHSIIIGILNCEFPAAQEAFDYIAKKQPGWIATHDGELYPILHDEQMWTEDYWFSLTSDMMCNFSRERFVHIVAVGKKLFPNRMESAQPVPKRTSSAQTQSKGGYCATILTCIAVGIVVIVPILVWQMLKR